MIGKRGKDNSALFFVVLFRNVLFSTRSPLGTSLLGKYMIKSVTRLAQAGSLCFSIKEFFLKIDHYLI
ncbi:hypothetical protein J6TS2_23340 [Heyndrickxia sporothermodurans]|nr:hypothetical protein J6TS2_23340 [Heyndrickxia sporothermodurans]